MFKRFWTHSPFYPMRFTSYSIEVTDGAGKKATGYIGAVGTGETLGSELTTLYSNLGIAPYETLTVSGKDITSAINTAGYGVAFSDYTAWGLGMLYKLEFSITLNSGEVPSIYMADGTGGGGGDFNTGLVTGDNTIYSTFNHPGQTHLAIYNPNPTNFSSINTSRRVTEPPATAVHIVSSLNGTTRNWESIESGFNPNTIASWKIYDLSRPGFYLPSTGSTFNRGDFTNGNAFFWSSIDISPYAGS